MQHSLCEGVDTDADEGLKRVWQLGDSTIGEKPRTQFTTGVGENISITDMKKEALKIGERTVGRCTKIDKEGGVVTGTIFGLLGLTSLGSGLRALSTFTCILRSCSG